MSSLTTQAWIGLSSFDSLSQLLNEGNTNNVIGLFIVCGSWNRPMAKQDQIQQLLNEISYQCFLNNNQIRYVSGILQVDTDDDGLTLCCGDNDDKESIFPCPPEQLPALLYVGRRGSMPRPESKYILSYKPEEILKCWEGNHSINPTMVQKELQDRYLFLGLNPPSLSTNPISLPSSSSSTKAIRIFIAGDRMSVGKTSVCLGLIGSLVQAGMPCESLAYIKPATQNESPQLVQKYCEKFGIECVPIGPVVYYRGFTRAFLAGNTESTSELLSNVSETVDRLAIGKRVVIIDGVGFPAVGSICGTDNASVARSSGYPGMSGGQRIPPGVLVVGGSGVGGAVDAFNLNATYFERANVPVIGAIFNKLSLDGFYSLENCKKQITSYFDQNQYQRQLQRKPFGFVPMYPDLGSGSLEAANEYIRLFSEHVDMNAILQSAFKVQSQSFLIPMMTTRMTTTDGANDNMMITAETGAPPASKRQKTTTTSNNRSREEIEQAAIQAGAAPSA